MTAFFSSYDLDERTVRDYDFTRRAVRQIHDVVTSASFEDMEAEGIFRFLFQEMEIVPFKDYLKRYLHERSEMEEPLKSVPDAVWQEMIEASFEENRAPHSFTPTTTRWSATVKSWLNSNQVRRGTVFLLGFGLRMSVQDVTEFLTKVLKEADLDLNDPTEAIYRFCFLHDLNYAAACGLMKQYEAAAPVPGPARPSPEDFASESALMRYLAGLKYSQRRSNYQEKALEAFQDCYAACCRAIAAIYQKDEEEKPEKERRIWTEENVGPADIEKMLCSGIPVTESGNLAKANQSLLNRQFQSYRMSRQRIDSIFKRQVNVERYDLITLTFFLEAQREEITGEERLKAFLDQANGLLTACGMGEMYPVNPYEAFVMVCILSDCPLAVYGDIWERSYGDGQVE